jgi:hypothetical protein
MAILERIKYDDVKLGDAWVGTLGGEFLSPKNNVVWWPSHPPTQVPEITYVGVPMQRGIKLTPFVDTDALCGVEPAEARALEYGGYARIRSAFMKAFEQPAEIEFLGFPTSARDDSLIASVDELGEILSTVNDLAFQIEEDEYGLVRPSYHAHRHCMRILLAMARSSEFIRPSDIGTDRNGAIRIAWIHEGREAELVCPSESVELPYVYYSSKDSYGTDTEITPAGLISRIRWAKDGK